MNIRRILLIAFFLISLGGSAGAQLLDSLTLDTLTAFTSLEDAMKDPEKVIKLELRRKKLKSFPKEIFLMKNLQYLDLSKNDIRELPDSIRVLKDLQFFSISKNELEEINPAIGELINLYYFNANQNNLTALPWEIGNLTKLRNLDLWSNNIERFPDDLKKLQTLKVMDLRVILISDSEQERLQSLLPHTKIYFSPYCKCVQ
jgi:Leucine-rich repeat (LRR) protein